MGLSLDRHSNSPSGKRILIGIRTARKELNYSQRDIGFYLGISATKYSRIECGIYALKAIDFIKLFYLFEKPMHHYLSLDELVIPDKDIFGNPNIAIIKALIKKIKYTAKVKNITRDAITAKTGLTDKQLRRFFKIEQPISFENLTKLAAGLDTTPGFLLGCLDTEAEKHFKNNYLWGTLLSVRPYSDDNALAVLKKIETMRKNLELGE